MNSPVTTGLLAGSYLGIGAAFGAPDFFGGCAKAEAKTHTKASHVQIHPWNIPEVPLSHFNREKGFDLKPGLRTKGWLVIFFMVIALIRSNPLHDNLLAEKGISAGLTELMG
jgi:hypothetical protein